MRRVIPNAVRSVGPSDILTQVVVSAALTFVSVGFSNEAAAVIFADANPSASYTLTLPVPSTVSVFPGPQLVTGSDSASASLTADTGLVSFPQTLFGPDNQVVFFTWQGEAIGTASASASYGSVHATASSTYSLTPLTVTLVGTDAEGNTTAEDFSNPITVTGSGVAAASFEDQIMISSATLAVGTPVQVRITAGFDGSGNGGTAKVFGNISPNFSPTLSFGGFLQETINNGGTQQATFTDLVPAEVGIPEYFTGSVFVSTDVPFGACQGSNFPINFDLCGTQTGFEDASNTANFFVDPVGSDYTISFASGHDYSSPAQSNAVPEPPSLARLSRFDPAFCDFRGASD